MILSLQKRVSNCGDKPKWNDLYKVQPTEIPKFTSDRSTPIDSNDIFKHCFFNTFLNQADKAMDKKKINKKNAKYWKNETVKYELSKENVDCLLPSTLGRRLEVGDERDYEDEYEHFVQNSKKKKWKRNQLRKHKETTPKKLPLKKIRQSIKRNSHINHRHLSKVKSMKKNKRHFGKYLSTEDKEICETNFINFIDNTQTKSSTSMAKSSFCICENDISPKGSDCILESYKNITLDNSRKTKCELDPEEDVIKNMQLRVLDRILNSALGKINNNNQYNDQCVNKEKIREQGTLLPANKSNENHPIEISKQSSKKSSLVYLNGNSPKDRSILSSFSVTKVKKPIRKTKRKYNTQKKRKKYCRSDYELIAGSKLSKVDRLIISALHEGVVDDNGDEYNVDEVYDDNVDSHNVYNHKISDTKELTNFLMSYLSSYVERL